MKLIRKLTNSWATYENPNSELKKKIVEYINSVPNSWDLDLEVSRKFNLIDFLNEVHFKEISLGSVKTKTFSIYEKFIKITDPGIKFKNSIDIYDMMFLNRDVGFPCLETHSLRISDDLKSTSIISFTVKKFQKRIFCHFNKNGDIINNENLIKLTDSTINFQLEDLIENVINNLNLEEIKYYYDSCYFTENHCYSLDYHPGDFNYIYLVKRPKRSKGFYHLPKEYYSRRKFLDKRYCLSSTTDEFKDYLRLSLIGFYEDIIENYDEYL